jgi:prevent-host-death family protein
MNEMKYASVRDFRINASKVMEEAKTEEIIVTKRGHPFALLVPISEDDVDRIRSAVKAARFHSTLEDLWKESAEKGADKMTMEEINAEIKAYRKEKRPKSRH